MVQERQRLDPIAKTRVIAGRLDACYGRKQWTSHGPPLDELVATILSQNTSDVNSSRAFCALKERFPTWQEVIAAPSAAVAETIRSGGLANTKAPRIQAAVSAAENAFPNGDFTRLRSDSVADARAALVDLPGIGPKTASCVLLFSLGIPAMPVDTHVHRVARRTGMIEPSTSAEDAHEILESRLGGELEDVYSFHLNTIRHGRTVCQARTPHCGECCLNDLCDYARNRTHG
jgi:endonuclease-3